VPGWTKDAIAKFVRDTLFGAEGTLVVQVTQPTALFRGFGGTAGLRGRGPFTYASPRGFGALPRGLYRQLAALLPSWGNDLSRRGFLRARRGTIVLVGCAKPQGRLPGGGLQIGLPN
jgi:hypothetical protein